MENVEQLREYYKEIFRNAKTINVNNNNDDVILISILMSINETNNLLNTMIQELKNNSVQKEVETKKITKK